MRLNEGKQNQSNFREMEKTAMQLVYDLVKSGLNAKEIVNALLADEKLLLEKEKEIIVDFTLKHSDDKVEKIAYDYKITFNISDKMKTPIEMLNAIIEMQEANYGRGSDTHMALNELAKEAKEVVKSYTANEK
jgi:tRNA A-37 threonylcarbamoyl transferase component Bud32